MWKRILDRLGRYPERLTVARALVENGLSIRDSKIWCNDILISKGRLARVAGVDARTVKYTIEMIEEDDELREVFGFIRSAGSSLERIAKNLDLGVIEIIPTDARIQGILASSASLIAEAGISIRQAIVDDSELSPEPNLTLITERKIPGDLILKFLRIRGVAKVSVY